VGRPYCRPTARQTLLLILVPLLLTAVGQRLYLHLVQVQHVNPAGYLVHHLYSGAVLVIAAAFVLAFGTRNRVLMILSPMTLGVGSAMVLDELVYLIATHATDDDYVSAVSLGGSVVLVSMAIVTLFILYRLHRDPP
jgi:hypothetical protein